MISQSVSHPIISHVMECFCHVRCWFVTLSFCLSVHPHIHTTLYFFCCLCLIFGGACVCVIFFFFFFGGGGLFFVCASLIHSHNLFCVFGRSVSGGQCAFSVLGSNQQLNNCFGKIQVALISGYWYDLMQANLLIWADAAGWTGWELDCLCCSMLGILPKRLYSCCPDATKGWLIVFAGLKVINIIVLLVTGC